MDLVDKKADPFEAVAGKFQKMAELIRKNTGENFGGAFVIVDPDGNTLDSLFLNDGTPGLFWGTLKAIADQQINAIDIKERQLPMGRSR